MYVSGRRRSQLLDPVREDALIGAAELPGAGQHAAAIDPTGKSKSSPYSSASCFAGQLGGAVERDRRGGRERLVDARGVRPAGRPGADRRARTRRRRPRSGSARKRRDGVDAAGARACTSPRDAPAVLEHVDACRAGCARRAAGCWSGRRRRPARSDWRRRRSTQSHAGQRRSREAQPQVAVMDGDAEPPQARPVRLAARPDEVVDARYIVCCRASTQARSQRRSHEAADAGDQQSSSRRACCCQASTISRDRLLERHGDVPAG